MRSDAALCACARTTTLRGPPSQTSPPAAGVKVASHVLQSSATFTFVKGRVKTPLPGAVSEQKSVGSP